LDSHLVSLRTELAPALPTILGDRVQLQQVIINLVMNGIEAMEPVMDRPRELVIRSGQGETRRVFVSVTDCGSGSPPKMQTGSSTLFSPPNPTAWVWGYRSAVRLSKLTVDDYPSPAMRDRVRRFNSFYRCIRRRMHCD
jgi:hypothetical protein